MRVAVISDIHANGRALAAVLDAVDAEQVDELWCLGDVVGYGPDPDECCATVRDRAAVCLVGNHDLAVLGTVDTADFNLEAALATEWTRAALGAESREFLAGLAPAGERHGVGLFHASPIDPIWDYVLTLGGARAAVEAAAEALVLVGHSHVPLAIGVDGDAVDGGHAVDGTLADLSSAPRWLLNPGSVGQPRDGDARAAWALLDLTARTAVFHRVPYDVAGTQAAMREQGLPEPLARRLAHGL